MTYDVERLVRERYQPWESISAYVVGVLLNQGSVAYSFHRSLNYTFLSRDFSHIGGYLPFKTMPYYIVGTVWCIATCVLVNAYNSTLISHLALPNQNPLINSIYDLRDRPHAHLVTNRNLNAESLLLVELTFTV